uniref:Defensin-like protein n=1 Tax=Cajanus cajan TaxID=3821 RepID=A0A151QVF1_CAJCA|nr:hypothetical protein KK1_044715 [Cajanus cajan]
MKAISSLLFIVLVLSIGIENGGPLKGTYAKLCDIKLYDYCDDTCTPDCLKKYGKKVTALCNESGSCICRYQC